MTQTTRLKESDRSNAVESLHKTLDNIIKFNKFPLEDPSGVINLWNSHHDPKTVEHFQALQSQGYPVKNNFAAGTMRLSVPVTGTKVLTTLFRLEHLYKDPGPFPWRFVSDTGNGDLRVKRVRIPFTSTAAACVVVSREDVLSYLGESAEETLTWMANCAEYVEEVKDARLVIGDIFEMTKTAGQLKRMVPDLLQYLPEALRRAYEQQKRASSLPFEWAAYDKRRVENMILAVSKGHLLNNIRTNNEYVGYENVAATTWCFYGEIISA